MQPDLFSDDDPDPSGNEHLAAFIAPLAKDSDAVIKDPGHLKIAEAVFAAYSATAAEGGLSRGELWNACSHLCDEEAFQQRFTTFRKLRMLLPAFRKEHEDHYILHPISMAGVLVAQRLRDRGGVSEILALLDSTRTAIEHGAAGEEDVRASLVRCRRMLTVVTDHLSAIVATRPLAELIRERRHHEHPELMSHVESLTRMVTEFFPDLDGMAVTVTTSAQRYVSACIRFLGRLLDEGARSEDFRILHHEQYLTAAMEAPPDLLAEVFTHVVVDLPDPGVFESAVVEAVEALNPDERPQPKPSRVEHPVATDDPLVRIEDKIRSRRDEARRVAELVLDERPSTSLTDYLRSLGWPEAAKKLTQLLHEGQEKDSSYWVATMDGLYVNSVDSISYLSEAELRRAPANPPMPPAPLPPGITSAVGDGGDNEEAQDDGRA
ncbi:hypothetical protein [Nocardiopsis dassonvillei]|uniref:hypothetical protein n=1 Tax=Nocardiopsis dassonvillei TaxID=2014 RepID=UPI00362EBC5C